MLRSVKPVTPIKTYKPNQERVYKHPVLKSVLDVSVTLTKLLDWGRGQIQYVSTRCTPSLYPKWHKALTNRLRIRDLDQIISRQLWNF